MDRPPKPAPFPKGAVVRYVGEREEWIDMEDGRRAWLRKKGLEVEIVMTRPGHQGTLDPIEGFENDPEPPVDRTVDGASLYVPVYGHGRFIRPDDARDWTLVRPPPPDPGR